MDISTAANLINAIAVTAGVIFAAVQITQYRQRRHRDAMLELVRSFQSPAFTSALRQVLSLPDGANAEKIREVLGPDGEDAVYLVSLTWESLGILLFRREVTLDLIDDFFSGPTMSSPQVANGQDIGMVLGSEAGACGLLANFWQATQRRIISSAFFMAVGQ